MKRAIRSFEAEPDVNKMLAKAADRGVKIGFVCNAALKQWLTAKGFGPRKEKQKQVA